MRKNSAFAALQVTEEAKSGQLNQDECLIVQAREINMESEAFGIKYPSIRWVPGQGRSFYAAHIHKSIHPKRSHGTPICRACISADQALEILMSLRKQKKPENENAEGRETARNTCAACILVAFSQCSQQDTKSESKVLSRHGEV
jgi:hypothetical protein